MLNYQQMDLPEMLRQAIAHHRAQRIPEAESIYHLILDKEPRHPEALRLMGILMRQRGCLDAARKFLEQAIVSKPDSPSAHFDLAMLHFDAKELESTIKLLQEATRLQPVFPEAHRVLGNAYAASWFLDKAIESYQMALEQGTDKAQLEQCLSYVQGQLGHVAKIAERFREGLDTLAQKGLKTSNEAIQLETRDLIPHVLNQLGLGGTGVEIGVREGLFSEHLAQHWNGTLLYSIDPWREFSESEYVDSANVSQNKQDELYRTTIKRLLPYTEKSVIWRLTSKEAASLIPDGSLDFCYLDADHSARAIREDIQLWFVKVRRGGVLGGHDYIPDGTYSFGTFGVHSAVNEFVKAENLDLILSKETPFRSWFVIKR